MSDYPQWICRDCGIKYGRGMPEWHRATYHSNICDVCGKEVLVTEPRDYGHLKPEWREEPKP